MWLLGERHFDIWICDYGEQAGRYKDIVEFYSKRKGGKFPNLYWCYQHYKDRLSQYEAILVSDDDMLIDTQSINRLFEIRTQYDLWALQPANRLKGKVSTKITRTRPFRKLRFTNFVEMAYPLIRTDKLFQYLEVYDPILVGWGNDWWLMHTLGTNLRNRVAIVDAVDCINPHDTDKGGHREISKLQPTRQRRMVWEEIKQQFGIREYKRITYKSELLIRKNMSRSFLIIFEYLSMKLRRLRRAA